MWASYTSGWFCLKFANPVPTGDETVCQDEFTMSRNSGELSDRDVFLIDLTKMLD